MAATIASLVSIDSTTYRWQAPLLRLAAVTAYVLVLRASAFTSIKTPLANAAGSLRSLRLRDSLAGRPARWNSSYQACWILCADIGSGCLRFLRKMMFDSNLT